MVWYKKFLPAFFITFFAIMVITKTVRYCEAQAQEKSLRAAAGVVGAVVATRVVERTIGPAIDRAVDRAVRAVTENNGPGPAGGARPTPHNPMPGRAL